MATATEPTTEVSIRQPAPPPTPSDFGTLKATALQFKVIDEESFQVAAEMVRRGIRWRAGIESLFAEGQKKAWDSHQWFIKTTKKLCEPYDVRLILEPKMVAYKMKKEADARAIETARLRKEEDERRRAEQEARAIQAKADAEAAEFRRQGDIRAARAVTALAAEEAKTVIAEAVPLAVIAADTRPQAEGVNDRRPWVGRVLNPMDVIRAVAEGKVPLMHTIPVKTRQEDGKFRDVMTEVPIVQVTQAVVDYLAKRLGMEDIGIPGVKGERELGLSFRRTDDPGPAGAGDLVGINSHMRKPKG